MAQVIERKPLAPVPDVVHNFPRGANVGNPDPFAGVRFAAMLYGVQQQLPEALKIADGSCNLIEDLTNSPQVEVVCTILDAAGNAKLLRFQAKRAPTMIMKLRDAGADGDAK